MEIVKDSSKPTRFQLIEFKGFKVGLFLSHFIFGLEKGDFLMNFGLKGFFFCFKSKKRAASQPIPVE